MFLGTAGTGRRREGGTAAGGAADARLGHDRQELGARLVAEYPLQRALVAHRPARAGGAQAQRVLAHAAGPWLAGARPTRVMALDLP